MGKLLWIEDEQLDKSHPGCISGIFHAFDYHYWNSNVKKILPNRKHETLIKHANGNRRYRRVSDDQDPFEVLKLLDPKTGHILVDQSNMNKAIPAQKLSLKARIKSFIFEHNNAEHDKDFVSSPKLQRTYSIHHLETNEWVHPIIFFPEYVTESSRIHGNLAAPEANESRDILEMLEVDKDLFINTLHNRSLSSDTKPRLTKSGSYPMKLKDKLNEVYTISKPEKTKTLHDDFNCSNVVGLRRVFSLNEAADRCTRFLDFSVGKEATLRACRSLKLTSGGENLFRNDQNHRSRANSPAAFSEDAYGLKIEEDGYQMSREIIQESHVLEPVYFPQDEKVQISKGFQETAEKEMKTVNKKKHIQSPTKDDDFAYVKKILQRSGFLKNAFQQTWYSYNHPLDPFVFQELESHYIHDPDRFAEEVNELSHRLLVFDLVDEILVTMYERSLTNYPKKLSSFCHIRPAPTGSLVLDEVWDRVSGLVKFKHDVNESLNDIVGRDLGCDDGWMNLQLDSECVGFDLEDLILDEILEEVVFGLV